MAKDKIKRPLHEDEDEDDRDARMAAQYAAARKARRERERQLVGRNSGGGLSLLGVTLTGGLLLAFGLLLLAGIGAALFWYVGIRSSRLAIASGICFVFGGILLINALFGGGDD
jgi:hypothetical protein